MDSGAGSSNLPLTVCLTGGGTAGHVTPHFALLPDIRARGWRVFYVGSHGLEANLVQAQGLRFYAIAAGKLRRYLSWQNLTDIFRIAWGFLQAWIILRRERPDIVFSKGGFVAVPVAAAAHSLGIPVVSHESDLTPGLANRLIAKVAHKILYTFAETGRHLPANAELVGTPIRAELFTGDPLRGLRLCGFAENTSQVLLVMGGSQGAQRINEALLTALPQLVKDWHIIHLSGKGKGLAFAHPRYKGFEFVSEEFKDLLAAATAVVSRAGANSLFELLALHKPMLLIPLQIGSRGDQVLNAQSFAAKGWAMHLDERELSGASLLKAIEDLRLKAPALQQAMREAPGADSVRRILDILQQEARGVRQ